ncbi:DNA repair protein RAD50 [Rhizoctonia solani 123E]|uniref:DNA repair protein RAD50 n=1 Tax=Rhizoctonia solani 123E TaxID=1423351 RepID=A0A074S6L9_9AGAM|nr:DNA repair protein RAD50 [Rhizoctonia solani 123E]
MINRVVAFLDIDASLSCNLPVKKYYRASLNKLAIRGIRSFDDKSVAVIEFYSPVTVIVGHNGSGKTTIIECLKYATTGEQPPNTRGGAFIHDPKMANEKEVKAQVKLRFFAANRTRMLAVRNLSVTMTKTKMTMKTLEGILATSDGAKDNNKRGVISTKCAELDAEIPHLLGVSKSVLENVIFCHQEDSYWPLAEASVLKKKFDDIFEATRYTKALDNIKALRKERVADLKADKERLHSLGLEKAHADRLKSKIDDLTSQVADKTQESEETEAALDAQVTANTKFYDSATRFQQIFLKVEHLEERRTQAIRTMEELKQTVTLVDDPTDVLKSKMENYDAHCASQRAKRAAKATELLHEEESLTEARRDHQEAVNTCGEMRGQAKTHEQNIIQRDTEINNIGTKYGIRPNTNANGSLDRDSVMEFNARLGEMARAQALELERLQNEYEFRSNEYQSKKTELQTEENALKHEKETLKAQMQRNRNQISTAETSLDTLRLLETELKLATSAVVDARDRLSNAKAAAKESSFESQIAERTSALAAKTDERDRLQQKLADLQSQAETRAKLGLKRTDFSRKRAEIDTIIGIHNERFKAMLGTDAEAETMERDVDQMLIAKDKEIAHLEADASTTSREMHSAESALTSCREQIRKKEAEFKTLDQRVKSGLADSEHATVSPAIKAAQDELDNWLEEIGQHEGASHFYSKIMKDGKTHKKCVVCNRKMDEGQLAEFEKTVNGHIQKRDTKYLEDCKQNREDWASEVGRLQALLPVEEARDKLRDEELPMMKRRAEELDAKAAKSTAEAQEAEAAVKAAKSVLKELQSLKSQAGVITRTQQEVKSLQREIQQHERDLAATGSTQTADEVQAEIDQCGAHIKTLDRERTSLMAERDRQYQTLRSLENEYSSRQLEESEMKNRMKDRDSLTREIETLMQGNLEASSKLKTIDGKLAGAQQPLQKLEQEQKKFQSEHNSTIALVSRRVQELNSAVDRLDNISAPIERYIRERKDRALRQCETRVSEAAARIVELEQSVQGLREEVAEIDREIHESGATLAKFRDNLSLRRMKQEIENLRTEIDQHDLEQAGAAKAQFEEKYQIEKDKENKLRSKQARLAGELGILKSQLKTSKQELASQFQGIHDKYTKQLVQVKMADMANNDLEKYAKALDNAIMKYHALKMEEVNDTMRHLWNKTYQGTDIDGIKIVSDPDGGGTGTKKASYNYRVVMMKDQVEMDMRGRCSAGQKMLASIIIRLALSDSFGQNCGILALDEPTNALDTENIDALAGSLVDIINERRHLSNFQLIIITHDESFLRKLGQAEVMEYYWRVSRDSRQKSVIERQRFN